MLDELAALVEGELGNELDDLRLRLGHSRKPITGRGRQCTRRERGVL